ncbi:hypothetical protein [Sulfitobacter sp. 1A12157]|uniref:hypothetical protein n=1 Tax=Sulfitobacter sp. 1A12157 TaxID=3368594 RepID=UPI003746409F
MNVGSIIFWRDNKFGHHRFWEVRSILLGAEGQESLIGIRSLNYEPGTDETGSPIPELMVPECLIRGLVFNREGAA